MGFFFLQICGNLETNAGQAWLSTLTLSYYNSRCLKLKAKERFWALSAFLEHSLNLVQFLN